MDGGLQMKKQGRLCFMFFNICFIADMILLLCTRVDKYLLENLSFEVLGVVFSETQSIWLTDINLNFILFSITAVSLVQLQFSLLQYKYTKPKVLLAAYIENLRIKKPMQTNKDSQL